MAALANAHGYFVTPTARQPGTAYQDACGMQAYYQMSGDINGNIQGLEQTVASQTDYHPAECHLWKCKGMKYADNKDNVHKYTAGETVKMNFDIRAPHTGYANISIVKTSNNKIIAANLKKWDVYASNAVPTVASQENFSVKMPTTLGSKCATAGDCVIQMYWNAPSVDQTYESCIDFTMAGTSKRDALGEEEQIQRAHPRDFSPREGEE
ncbi:hypothetical protein LTR85_010244 [Meristemomyces frigidus]|nr:hypothetical protein LTR85_010244 [Meristemomyces frigidus]